MTIQCPACQAVETIEVRDARGTVVAVVEWRTDRSKLVRIVTGYMLVCARCDHGFMVKTSGAVIERRKRVAGASPPREPQAASDPRPKPDVTGRALNEANATPPEPGA